MNLFDHRGGKKSQHLTDHPHVGHCHASGSGKLVELQQYCHTMLVAHKSAWLCKPVSAR